MTTQQLSIWILSNVFSFIMGFLFYRRRLWDFITTPLDGVFKLAPGIGLIRKEMFMTATEETTTEDLERKKDEVVDEFRKEFEELVQKYKVQTCSAVVSFGDDVDISTTIINGNMAEAYGLTFRLYKKLERQIIGQPDFADLLSQVH